VTVAGRVTANWLCSGLDAVREVPLTDAEFDGLWLGISRDDGHRLAHLLIHYNAERATHHRRWAVAMAGGRGPFGWCGARRSRLGLGGANVVGEELQQCLVELVGVADGDSVRTACDDV
jgi:hypothetical protein